jgi:1-deoxy-D-xylulose-5-phosphate reductoisomerase
LKYVNTILGNQSLHIALNAADEVAVYFFLKDKISFLDIIKTIDYVIDSIKNEKIEINNFEDIYILDNKCRKIAENYIKEEL